MTAVDVTEKPPSPPAGEDGAGEEFPFGLDERGPDEPRRRWHLPEAIN
ncbi:MAG: hypothetical protein QOE15_538, partial [Acidimicrobiaceae bacterium]|nr:hypothetical protein [Acidimicrobiaceae bacterium]